MRTFPKFNDGVAFIYREKERNTGFNAKVNAKALDDLDFVCKVAYEQMTKREQDQEFANQSGHSLNMKVRTRYVSFIDNKCKAVIDNTLYDIYDIDKTRTELYLYLEEARKIVT